MLGSNRWGQNCGDRGLMDQQGVVKPGRAALWPRASQWEALGGPCMTGAGVCVCGGGVAGGYQAGWGPASVADREGVHAAHTRTRPANVTLPVPANQPTPHRDGPAGKATALVMPFAYQHYY